MNQKSLSLLVLILMIGGSVACRRDTTTNPPQYQTISDVAYQADDLLIYGDQLDASWQDWSYSVLFDSQQSSIRRDGERAIGVTYSDEYGGVQLVRDVAVNGQDFSALQLAVRGGSRGQMILVALMQEDMEWTEKVAIEPPHNEWAILQIPLQAFGSPRFIRGIVIQEGLGRTDTTLYVDDLALIAAQRQGEGQGPALTIDITAEGRPISPYIYGLNFADNNFAEEIALPINRWGGNAVTRYNWQLDVSNRARDWYYLNVPNEVDEQQLPHSAVFNDFIQDNNTTTTESVLTLPLIGWTPKSRERSCGFALAKYGEQQGIDPENRCGNGLSQDGDPLSANDPTDTSTIINEQFIADWVAYLVDRYGAAEEGGVRFYSLDNEPMLWHITHRDVHPVPVTYDEIGELTKRYAAAVKAIDSSARTLGPVVWGWSAYFYSAHDLERADWRRPQDRLAHDDLPFIEWYLQQMAAYEQQHGVRLLDYLDLHYYPQQAGMPLTVAGDRDLQQARLRSTRALWDPTYRDESWINEPIMLIPRMHAWIAENYPGTKLSLSEYNWGGLEHINGALVQSDLLGIFGREGLDMAMLWQPPAADDPGAYAFRIYRNYDGRGSQFGDRSLEAHSADWDRIAVYAARRSSDDAVTIVVINKTFDDLDTVLNFTGLDTAELQSFSYSPRSLNHIVHMPAESVIDGRLATRFPAQSITLFVTQP